MLKNNKGVTILILVITVVVLIIIVGVTVNTSYDALKNVRVGRIISNMTLVQAKVETIYENYQFSEDPEILVGVKNDEGDFENYTINNIDGLNILQKERELLTEEFSINIDEASWYKWDAGVLKSQGLDYDILDNNTEAFYVNYETAEVIYTKGATMDNENYYYTLTGIENAFEND